MYERLFTRYGNVVSFFEMQLSHLWTETKKYLKRCVHEEEVAKRKEQLTEEKKERFTFNP